MLLPLLPSERADNERYNLLLQMAIRVGDVECINLLIDRNINVNATGYYYGTPLQCAAHNGKMDYVQLLLNCGANVNVTGGSYGTALRAAVVGGHEKIVELLFERGADANLSAIGSGLLPHSLESILLLSLRTPKFAIVRLLVAAGAHINLDKDYQDRVLKWSSFGGNRFRYSYEDDEASALHMACAKGLEVIARFLIEHGANIELEVVDKNGKYPNCSKTPLQIAARSGNTPIVRLLLESGVNIDHCNYHGTALSIACAKNKFEVVEELLLAGAAISEPSNPTNALAEACKHGHHGVVSLLLEELSGTEQEEVACNGALSSAASNKDDKTFRVLFGSMDDAALSPSMLWQACAASLSGSVLGLLARGIDVNSENEESVRAIHISAFYRQPSIVEVLLRHGAKVNYTTKKYGNALQSALEGEVQRCDKYREGPEAVGGVNIRMKKSEESNHTVETEASRSNSSLAFYPVQQSGPLRPDLAECERVVHLLLDHGAEMEAETRELGIPLHLAAFLGSRSIVQRLLEKGADINSHCEPFSTALFASLKGDHKTMTKFILQKGIDINYVSPKHGSALQYACLERGKALVQTLLFYGADVNVIGGPHGSTFAALINTPWSYRRKPGEDQEIASLLLQHGGYKIQESDWIAAASAIWNTTAQDYIKMFLEHDKTFKVTEPILIAALKHMPQDSTTGAESTTAIDALHALLQRDGLLGVTPAMIGATESPTTMEFLLKHRPLCNITAEMVAAASRQWRGGRDLMQVLLDHATDMPITEDIVVLALRSSETDFVFSRRKTVQIGRRLRGTAFCPKSSP